MKKGGAYAPPFFVLRRLTLKLVRHFSCWCLFDNFQKLQLENE